MTRSTTSNPERISTAAALGARLDAWRREGKKIALVPTMGALHAGHLALAARAHSLAERIVVSIFINPTQFAPNEDLTRYPRDFERDRSMLGAQGLTDVIYAPAVDEMYPHGIAAEIKPKGPASGLESDFRPHFFAGVATVVAKLFLQCRPDFAMFGEKDYQQLLVVTQLARDLELKLQVVGVPTVREADGLALSSRNAYLDAEQRKIAGHLNVVLREASLRARGGTPIAEAEAEGAAQLISAGFDRVDYVAIRDAETLAPLRELSRPARILAAARIGGVRLIDNMAV